MQCIFLIYPLNVDVKVFFLLKLTIMFDLNSGVNDLSLSHNNHSLGFENVSI